MSLSQSELVVGLVDCTQARTDDERTVCKILASNHPISLTTLIDRFSEFLYRQTVKYGGWVINVGIWDSRAFRKEAERIVRDMDNRCIKLTYAPQATMPTKN